LLDNAGYYGVPRRVAKVRAEHWLKMLNLWGKRKKVSGYFVGWDEASIDVGSCHDA